MPLNFGVRHRTAHLQLPKVAPRLILVLASVFFLIRSFNLGERSWRQLENPERTADWPFSILIPDHASARQVAEITAAARAPYIAQERARGASGLRMAAVNAAAGIVVLALGILPLRRWFRREV